MKWSPPRPVLTAVTAAAGLAACALLLAAVPASAQLVHASARSVGLAGNDTAVTRAFGAISVNPAGLAMRGSEFSLALLPLRAYVGVAPITLADWKEHEGELVERATKLKWMDAIAAAPGQRIAASAGATELALTLRGVGLQLSTAVAASVRLPPEVMEALLFGNLGRVCQPGSACEAEPKTLSFDEGTGALSATTTAGLSIAVPLAEWMEQVEVMQWFDQLSVGLTVTYTRGHAMAVFASTGSIPHDEPEFEFGAALIHTRIVSGDDLLLHYLDGGSGVGLDLGVMFSPAALDDMTVGASVRNVFNTFAWDTSKLVSRTIAGSIRNGELDTDFDTADLAAAGEPYDDADPELRKRVEEFTFKPAVRVGMGYEIGDDLTVTGDIHYRFGKGMAVDPALHVGGGVEYRVFDPLHLRAGGAYLTDDFRNNNLLQYGGGVSAILGPVSLSFAVAGQSSGQVLGQLVLSFGHP